VQSSAQLVFVSPLLHCPSPQYGPTTALIEQLLVHVKHAAGGFAYAGVAQGVSVFAEPSSHCSPDPTNPSPHIVEHSVHASVPEPPAASVDRRGSE
jgi:hypothetical protein